MFDFHSGVCYNINRQYDTALLRTDGFIRLPALQPTLVFGQQGEALFPEGTVTLANKLFLSARGRTFLLSEVDHV